MKARKTSVRSQDTTRALGILRATGALLILAYIPIIRSARWESNLGWCTGGSKLFEGDFNGDGKTDLLFHRSRDGYIWIAFATARGTFTGTNWEEGIGWCSNDGSQIHIGDFNGDGRSDMLCHNTHNGFKRVAIANTNGDFSGRTSWQASLGWCYHVNSKLYIGDFNGDGRDDMLCHDTTGYKAIAYASRTGSFRGNDWERNIGWCSHPFSQIFIGDFNGDSKSDLLCHDSAGYKWIAYANSEGNFSDWTGWEGDIKFCHRTYEELYIGDFNGDGKDDLLCHNSYNGHKSVVFTNSRNNLNDGAVWQVDWEWCNFYSEELYVGDFNGDNRVDWLCHDTVRGKEMIFYSEFTPWP
ncbi:hypothetical protein HOLleu_36392 [Holothuria leucospilota]|uniref:VCBS repeat-containing protein n=1 Tax=Holothuria leucospilota TaxID=206669 RepID=A0A9Q1BG05_HOLLE|nr:hypothetical protein HOLleu_36392 [Holothuria leucospilota]